MKLIVTESDNGDSLTLPGQWSVDDVEYDEQGRSITTYEVAEDDKDIMEQALGAAEGVVSYRFYSDTSYAARQLRAILSETRSEQSRINGRKGGRKAKRP